MATSQPSPQQQNQSGGQNTTPQQPATTQQQLRSDDGAGIRGGYGDADQTNGLEGGANQPNSGDDAGQGQ